MYVQAIAMKCMGVNTDSMICLYGSMGLVLGQDPNFIVITNSKEAIYGNNKT